MFSAFLFLPYVFYSAHVRFIMKWCLKRKCLTTVQSSRKKKNTGSWQICFSIFYPSTRANEVMKSPTKSRINSSLTIEQIFGSRNTMCLSINQNLFNKKKAICLLIDCQGNERFDWTLSGCTAVNGFFFSYNQIRNYWRQTSQSSLSINSCDPSVKTRCSLSLRIN